MIRKVETFRSDTSDIKKEDIKNLIEYAKHVSIIYNDINYEIIVNFEFPQPFRYYKGSKSKIVTVDCIQNIEITKDSKIEEIMENIEKRKIETKKQLNEVIPV
jgi:hypothetical protein